MHHRVIRVSQVLLANEQKGLTSSGGVGRPETCKYALDVTRVTFW